MQLINLRKLRSIMLAILVCLSAGTKAETVVNVQAAGTLSTLFSGNDKELKLTGSINGTDVKYLRQLINDGKVTSLNLSEVSIVSGGVAYFESYTTSNGVIGTAMFKDCQNLTAVVLPNVSTISSNAFSRTGLKSVEIPNSVSWLGGDAFAYCNSLATVVIGTRVSKLDQGVFYSSAVKNAYVKAGTVASTPNYLFSSKPTIHVFTNMLNEYKQSSWAQYGTLVGGLEDLYPDDMDPSARISLLLGTYFEDAACTQLKTQYQAMSDDALTTAMSEGGVPDYIINIAKKVKNDDWAAYEKDFRIHSYNAHSDANYWNSKLMSTGGSYMGNPTGIYPTADEPLYVFVDDDVAEDATLYLAGCTGNTLLSNAQTGKRLTKGLNIVDGQKDALYYVIYTADTRSMTKTLSEWPDIKIHIEGGKVNGYYDIRRHSDSDYQALLKAATHERFTVKGERSVFNFKTSSYKTVWPTTIDKSISWFDSVSVWHKDLMGYTVAVAEGQRDYPPYNLSGGEAIFPIYYNNPNFAIEGEASSAGWANSSTYRTSYNSLECIRNSFNVNRYELDDWCANHECGHNNQGAIKLEGGTEVSNNLFANAVRFIDGLVTSSGSPLSTTMNDYAYHVPYYVRDVTEALRMYYQLYLYYHQARKKTDFFPTLFKALREDPLTLWKNSTENSGLKFVRKVCEVAQEDLTDFFAAWGFFEPCNMTVEDYGKHTLISKQADIDRTLAEIAQYPVKNRQILFVEDRADYVLTTDFLTTAGQHRRDSEMVGQYANLGQFTDYLPETAKHSDYTYLQADSLYAMSGTGGVGFIMLNQDNQMRYAANTLKFCIPSFIAQDFTIYSMDADGSIHEVTKAGSGAAVINLPKAGQLADSLNSQTIKATISGPMHGSDLKYMRQLVSESNLASIDLTNARMVIGGTAYYETYKSAANTVGSHLFSGCLNLINVQLPQTIIKIDDNAFSHSGINEITIPDAVASVGGDAFAYCNQLSKVTIGSGVKKMSQGVFYSSAVKDAYVKATTPPTIASYLFSSKPTIHVYASALEAYKASEWANFGTIVGDLDDYYDEVTAISLPQPNAAQATSGPDTPAYDLQGRKLSNFRSIEPSGFKGIYVRNGKKFIQR